MPGYYLTPFWGGPGVPRYALTAQPQIVGRSERVQIVLREPSVSREHAQLEVRDDVVWLEDLGSKHGTFANSKRVSRVQLRVGDIVVFGLVAVLRLEADPPVSSDGARGEHISSEASPVTVTVTSTLDLKPSPTASYLPVGGASGEAALAALGRVSLEHLPAAYARLTKVVDYLKQALAHRETAIAASSLLGILEVVSASVGKVMSAAATLAPRGVSPSGVLLHEVVEQALDRVRCDFSARHIDVQVDVAAAVTVRADLLQLVDVVEGLLVNAGQNCRDGNLMEIRGHAGDEGVVLSIADQGDGYPDEIVAELQSDGEPAGDDPLSRRLREAQHMAATLGGTLSVVSRRGVGAQVRLVLPVFEPEEFSQGE